MGRDFATAIAAQLAVTAVIIGLAFWAAVGGAAWLIWFAINHIRLVLV